jgi:Protein of unknown function (DUF2510)
VHVSIGWYPDPSQPGIERFWSGSEWTDERPILVVDLPEGMAAAAAAVRSTVGFELPSDEVLTRMGADATAPAPAEKPDNGAADTPPRRAAARRPVLRALSVVVVAAVVTTGSFVIVGRHSDANATVVAAVDSTLAGRSADIAITGSGTMAGSSFSITGTGAIDFTQNMMQASVVVVEGAQQVNEQVVYQNKVIYLNLGSAINQVVPGKSWVSLTLSQLSSDGGGSPLVSGDTVGNDPAAALQTLRAEGNAATDLGPSTVDGSSVEGYSVQITNPDVGYKVYVDSAGQLVRLTTDVNETLAGQSLSEVVTMDFTNYGAPVRVTPPPADEVTPFPSFLKAVSALSPRSGSLD